MKQTVQTLQAMKERGEKIAMLTCYDYTTAKLMDEAIPLRFQEVYRMLWL